MDEDWIPAAQAYKLVSAVAPTRAASAICSRAKDGLVNARARRLIWGKHSADDQQVPASFWWAGGDTALTQNWGTGDFETWIDHKLHCRAYGVEFKRSDIEAMLPVREALTPTVNRAEPGNFAPALKCREELRTTLSCTEKHAEKLILKACRAGLVSARCNSISGRVTDRYGATDFDDQNVQVPEWFWNNCLYSTDTVLNWQSGRFAGQGYVGSELHKAVLTGVQFQVGDVVELEAMERDSRPANEVPSSVPSAPVSVSVSTAGRRLSEKWRHWVPELVGYIHDNGAPVGVGSQGQEELINAIADALAHQGLEAPARSTVQPVIQAVLDRLRRAEN